MEFSVLDKQTIQCIMTETEFEGYGMDKKALFQNDGRTQEFFRQIMQRAQQETGFYREQGEVAVQASFLSDELLAITFYVGRSNPLFVTGILKSKNLADMTEFCRKTQLVPKASLYKYRSVYFLLADISAYGPYETAVFFNLADEYMDGICCTPGIASFIREHGTCLAAEHAVEILKKL